MRHDRPALSGNQPRIFHYTVAEHYNAIVQDGLIRPATEGVPSGERPAVWFSIHRTWEPTATKALRDRKTGKVHRATWKEMQRYGPVRIEVGSVTAPHRWEDYLRLSGASVVTARGLETRRQALAYDATRGVPSAAEAPGKDTMMFRIDIDRTWQTMVAAAG